MSTKHKWINGPWRVNEDSQQIGDVCSANDDEPIAYIQIVGPNRCQSKETIVIRQKRAQLVAAAPALLEACEKMVSHEEDILKLLKVFAPSDAEGNEHAEAEARIDLVRKAIALATGKEGK